MENHVQYKNDRAGYPYSIPKKEVDDVLRGSNEYLSY